MQNTDLRNLDFQQLLALRALVEQRSVSRAAAALNLSQPAMSRILARLRTLFGDPLLARSRKGLVATARAHALVEPLARLLDDAAGLIAPQRFDPAAARGEWRIAANDYAAQVVLPGLFGILRGETPGMETNVRPNDAAALEDLEAGRLDLALGVFRDAPAGFYRQDLVRDGFVALMRKDHPAARAKLSLPVYLKLSHLFVTLTGGGIGAVDAALARLGQKRRIAARVSTFMAVPGILRATDFVLSLPGLLADHLCRDAGLRKMPLPFRTPAFSVAQLWHQRRHADAAHTWLRAQTRRAIARS